MNNQEASIKNPSGQPAALSNKASNGLTVPKIFVVCDQKDTAPVWGYILRQQGLVVILETSLEKAMDRWSSEITDMIILDIDVPHARRMEYYKAFRAQSVTPLLVLLPGYHETEVLDAYAVGVDDVIIKPISPPIFMAKIMAWIRRSWTVPVQSLNLVNAGDHKLEPTRRSLVKPDGTEISLTNLEFHLLHLLMTRPANVFTSEEIVQAIWGGFGDGDQVLLKNVVYRLRKKIEADPSRPTLLQTGSGGYFFRG
jgi:two-component system OmpR family response regulator